MKDRRSAEDDNDALAMSVSEGNSRSRCHGTYDGVTSPEHTSSAPAKHTGEPNKQRAMPSRVTAAGSMFGGCLSPSSPSGLPDRPRTEAQFGQDFSAVRLHLNSTVANDAGALGLTRASDVHIATNAPDMASPAGRQLLGHELAHVVQQTAGAQTTQAKFADGLVPRLADRGLEAEADSIGTRFAAGESVVGQISGRTQGPVSQHWEAKEHTDLGNEATQSADGTFRFVKLGKKGKPYSLPYGDVVAMAGDHFENIEQMHERADGGEKGVGSREELEYVRWCKIKKYDMAKRYDKKVRAVCQDRYHKLAGVNHSHFLNPRDNDAKVSPAERAGGDPTVMADPRYMIAPQNGSHGYRLNHVLAIKGAVQAGKNGADVNGPLAAEAFGGHFLTDAFSAGHVRTARTGIKEYWDAKIPMFRHNVTGFVAEGIARKLSPMQKGPLPVAAIPVHIDSRYHIAFGKVKKKLVAMPLGFGDMVSGAVHDYDNKHGIAATSGGKSVTLLGDGKLSKSPDARNQAVAAVGLGVAEVERAYQMGAQGMTVNDAIGALLTDGLFAAEALLPVAKPDGQQGAACKSIKWRQPNLGALLGNKGFQAALKVTLDEKLGEFKKVGATLAPAERTAFNTGVYDKLAAEPFNTILKIIHWVPPVFGGATAAAKHGKDYVGKAQHTKGGMASLTFIQRQRLIRMLLRKPEQSARDIRAVLASATPSQRTRLQTLFGDKLPSE